MNDMRQMVLQRFGFGQPGAMRQPGMISGPRPAMQQPATRPMLGAANALQPARMRPPEMMGGQRNMLRGFR